MQDEKKLIEQALSGDRSAFTDLVTRHQERLFASMVQVTGSVEEAEDVVQEAFIRAFLKLDTFQQNSQFFTWLYRIAFNSALSRRRRRRPNVSLDFYREATGDEISGNTDDVDERLLRNERVRMVRMAIDRMSENHRAVLILREMQNRSYEEMAELLQISIGTVRSRLNRARAQLKVTIEAIAKAESGTATPQQDSKDPPQESDTESSPMDTGTH